ncbi:hypothetical protein PTTG_07389 [Puccinia triticina 1-1 BBBD Race 1]|uniref:Trafficking protein particle complex subunit 11 domain-containing protein n=1 Tax=Puccinia triticina (isolate 1-1 / race 1 (BBBD)) TaxID=630390 RepID=A0A180GHK1_PUCT1|nr:hypothetical protein PTTG_07389 [Puccinia triticina 1-1 BBBD Race 1]
MEAVQASSPPPSIIVSYHTSPSPDVWGRIQADLHRQLPLKTLHWKPKNRPLRLIPSLPIAFQAFDPAKPPSPSSTPFVYLLFVACDDHEAYKTIIKQEIRTWLDSVQASHSEWLIVHVSTAPKLNPSTAGIFRTKTGVLDKLKADFNPQKMERCIQLSYMSTMDSIVQASMQDSSTQWTELITRLKQSVLLVFEFRINEMEESLRMMVSKRSRHGWDFQAFFIQKAQLANQFEMMNLFEDSLIQYDELDAAFSQSLSDCPQMWHDKIYGKSSSRYSRLALNTDPSQEYLKVVGAGQMSIFDLRIFIFSKQISLLGQLGRLDEAVKRASVFISTFAAFLRSHEHTWPANYIESWVYCACNELVEWCEKRITPGNKDIATLDSLRCCAQLLELAHSQLDRIGIQAGHLPPIHPFNMSLSHAPEVSSEQSRPNSSPSVTSPANLIDSLKDPKTFEKVYLDLARRTINLYQSTGRRRSALKLHCKTAAFEQTQARQESAHRLYSHLPAHYVDDKWTTIESSLLDRCASLQKELGLSREWLLSTLALVRSGVTYEPGKWSQDVMLRSSTPSQPDQAGPYDQSTLASKLMQDIKEQSLKLEKDFAAIGFPIFSIMLNSTIGRLSKTAERSVVEAKITNLLPCPIQVEAVRMKFTGKKSETLWFTAGASRLVPGQTVIDLFCATPVAETLVLDVSQIRISRILFQYYHRPQGSQNEKGLDQEVLEIVSFPKDLLGLEIQLELPPDIRVGEARKCLLRLFSGRNHLSQAAISISSDSEIKFEFNNSTLCDHLDNQVKLVSDCENKVIVEGIQPKSTVCLLVPFHTSVDESHVEVNISVDYRLREDPSIKRTFRKASKLKITQPIEVKIREIFRPNWVFTKFTLSTHRGCPLRIAGVSLELDEETVASDSLLSISPACTKMPSLVILPSQTSDHIFKVAAATTTTPSSTAHSNFSEVIASSRLKLIVKYRPIITEITECLRTKLMVGLDEDQRQTVSFLVEQVRDIMTHEERYDEQFYSTYLYDHVLHTRILEERVDWSLVCERVEKDQAKKRQLVDRICTVLKDSSPVICPPNLPWQSITHPFTLSRSVILATIDFQRASGEEGQVGQVGRPVPIDLLISTSFNWATPSPGRPPVGLVYEIAESSDQWLIGGRKRGMFIARDDGIEKINLVLVPLRPGYLNVPRVTIKLTETNADRSIRPTMPVTSGSTIAATAVPNLCAEQGIGSKQDILIQSSYSNALHHFLVVPSAATSKFIVPSIRPNPALKDQT